MRIIRRIALLMMSCAVAVSSVAATKMIEPSIFRSVDKQAMNEWVEAKMGEMTPQDKVAQLIIYTVKPDDHNHVKNLLKKQVGEYHVGGLLYSRGNLSGQAKTNNYAQSISKIPLLITLDGEWGLSMRLTDAPYFPKNMVLGAISNDRLLYEYGREVARECRAMGIHVNFAPVLDVNDNPSNPVIGMRSFGESPERVTRLAIAYSKGLEDGGVIATAKHFPGHGSTVSDSHKTLPTVTKKMHELNICEMVPFRNFVKVGLSGVMVAHLSVPAIDDSGTPSSLSEKHINGLLRKKLGFDGLIFTDALTMAGAKTEGSICVKALLAGNDLLLSPADTKKEIEAVLKAVEEGVIEQSVIDERCRKMLRYKYVLGLQKQQEEINLNTIVDEINAPEAAELIRKLWASAITVVKSKNKTLPIKSLDEKRIAVVSLGGGKQSMFQERCSMYATVDCYSLAERGDYKSLVAELKNGNYDLIIAGVHHLAKNNVNAINEMASAGLNFLPVFFTAPYELKNVATAIKDCSGVVLAYDDNSIAQDYAAQTIFGGNAAQGTLPVTIAGVAKVGAGVKYKAIRLGYALPQEVGMKASLPAIIDSIANVGVKNGAFSACQVLVARHGKVVFNNSYGTISYNSKEKVSGNSVFDLASMSKATATLSAIMKLYDTGEIKLSDRASKYIPGLRGTNKEDITIRELLYHESGMHPSLNMFYAMIDPESYKGELITSKQTAQNPIKIQNGAYGNKTGKLRTDILSTTKTAEYGNAIAEGLFGGKITYDSIMARIYSEPLNDNKKFVYSCLNFCLLMDLEQNVTGVAHDAFVEENFWKPLGANHITYHPLDKMDKSNVVATEIDTYLRRQLVHGYVHDELAAFSGGVQGNAGLFGNANDLAKLMQMWLNGGEYGGHRFLKKATVELFTTDKSPNSHRGLGFDKPNTKNLRASTACDEATPETYGHTGFTGTCFWVDPKNDLIFIFLSNRVNPTRDNAEWGKVRARGRIQTAVLNSIIK